VSPRRIATPAGRLRVRQPRVRDDRPPTHDGDWFESRVLRPYARRLVRADQPTAEDLASLWLYLQALANADAEPMWRLLAVDSQTLPPDLAIEVATWWRTRVGKNRRSCLAARCDAPLCLVEIDGPPGEGRLYVTLACPRIARRQRGRPTPRPQEGRRQRPADRLIRPAAAEIIDIRASQRPPSAVWPAVLRNLSQRGLARLPGAAAITAGCPCGGGSETCSPATTNGPAKHNIRVRYWLDLSNRPRGVS
jgi:hypothetical protein